MCQTESGEVLFPVTILATSTLGIWKEVKGFDYSTLLFQGDSRKVIRNFGAICKIQFVSLKGIISTMYMCSMCRKKKLKLDLTKRDSILQTSLFFQGVKLVEQRELKRYIIRGILVQNLLSLQ